MNLITMALWLNSRSKEELADAVLSISMALGIDVTKYVPGAPAAEGKAPAPSIKTKRVVGNGSHKVRSRKAIALGNAIRTKRESTGITQTELSKLLGLKHGSLSVIEAGRWFPKEEHPVTGKLKDLLDIDTATYR